MGKQLGRALRRMLGGLPQPRQTLLIGEGQTLVLNYHTLTHAEADQIKARVRADAPWMPVLIVCADDISARGPSPAARSRGRGG